MKKFMVLISMFVFIACGEDKINDPQKQLFDFNIEAQKLENGYVTLKVKNSLGKSFAYAEYSPTMTIPIPASQIRLVFSDTATIRLSYMSDIAFFQFKESDDGILLEPDGWCHVGIYFKIY